VKVAVLITTSTNTPKISVLTVNAKPFHPPTEVILTPTVVAIALTSMIPKQKIIQEARRLITLIKTLKTRYPDKSRKQLVTFSQESSKDAFPQAWMTAFPL